jgi:putative acetyltransferase
MARLSGRKTTEGGMMGYTIREDDLAGAQTRALLELHLRGMYETSPPEAVFALDLRGLQDAAVTIWGAWAGDRLAAVGALKMLGAGEAEVKSMRTHPDFLRRGAAAALLEHVIATARARGVQRLSLETGRGPAFEPALALYRRRGFADGGPFSEYRPNDFSQYLHMDL